MRMPSLTERFDQLEQDLLAQPMRIALMSNLPFAILRYEPDKTGESEWELRKRVRLLANKLEAHGFRVHQFSMADFLWRAIDESEGMAAIVKLEQERGFETAQRQINLLMSDPDFAPLPEMLAEKLSELNPKRDIVFLMRLAAFTPSIYHASKLLEEMMDRTDVPTIMFYPGGLEGHTGLRFMNIEGRDALGNYRVKIYG
jgi:BREX protein BrxB